MQPISVIVPVFNEEKIIECNLGCIISFLNDFGFNYEIILIDDGSTDRSCEIIKAFESDNIRILKNDNNMGKGFAVKKGVLASKKELILFIDADLSSPLCEINNLLKYIGEYQIVIGSRGITYAHEHNKPLYQKLMGKIGNCLARIFTVHGIKDTQCGIKLFRKECLPIFEKQTIDRWGFDIEILFLAQKMNFSIKEAPITWNHSRDRKVKFIDYFKTLKELYQIRKNFIQNKYDL